MRFVRLALVSLALAACVSPLAAQIRPAASRLTPNLADAIDRPLRYQPDGADFVITNGTERFNRSLYGGNTAFRADGGDAPEFVLYLPGRGGNLRFAVRTPAGAKWLHDAAQIETRYRPGELHYCIQDPLLGAGGEIRLAVLASAETEGLLVRVEAGGIGAGVELGWAFGGVNGQRGKRDGDIGTESVPISEWFQLRPEFCRGNQIELTASGFVLRARPATIVGVVPAGAVVAVADAGRWADAAAVFAPASPAAAPALPLAVGRVPLTAGGTLFLSLQRVAAQSAVPADLATYREVTAVRPGGDRPASTPTLAAPFSRDELPERFAVATAHFAAVRTRVAVDTPDPFLNAAVGALNVAADAVWDEPQQAIMHGAIAWRTKLLGWRGPYALDALGWHDRARRNLTYWCGRQNTDPIPPTVPPADEAANLARNEAGLHTNGDLSNSHYDMNLGFVDAVFRHLQWTGDLTLAREVWPVIQRHLAWERRLFRREFGPERLPLYEAYAAIWASDDLQYSGGGAMHASAYNYYHHQQAARLARLLGEDPAPYQQEADRLARAMRALLWVKDDATGAGGWFAEAKDWLGLQRVHPSAALWTFYHTLDCGVPDAREAWLFSQYVDSRLPQLPVRGPGVPAGLRTLGTSNWMPYDWSINNVVMAEAVHGALGYWQAGRPDAAWAVAKGSLLAAMYMGISPGNVGSMSYLDVYRRESQRDFADGSGVLSRALIEGLFGVQPDRLAGEWRVTPGWPAAWTRAAIQHPDFALGFTRQDAVDTYRLSFPAGTTPQGLRLVVAAVRDRVVGVTVNGREASWTPVMEAVGLPRIEVRAPAAASHEVCIRWAGEAIRPTAASADTFVPAEQGQMRWLRPPLPRAATAPVVVPTFALPADARCEPVDLTAAFNDRVTQIFRNEYRSPRSPFVSLALPKQGLGGWAGGVNKTAEIDDRGVRELAARSGGRLTLPNGVPFATPAQGPNVLFTSQWDNYPDDATLPLAGRARAIFLLLAGSTNAMQSRFENGEVVVTYADGTTTRLPLVNPETWWPIEQDYFLDDFQFRSEGPLPLRVDLKTGIVRELTRPRFKGRGAVVPGGAATVLVLPLEAGRELKSLTVRCVANDVVVGLMAATLVR
ncbi:DUF4450 domain-containing protein [Opitutus sp. ER46]|uniref:DUF4450 domain-containing protein n=1 Tax=Opitutus sp. ER46 TaxID=2161864 RepID=UPI000D2FB268|nr:DUF4450 domain-containing protein [Opitutus sp. ER46]PTX96435.1 hypothetical protein DB354_07160 [Opitutus sp. ER46]